MSTPGLSHLSWQSTSPAAVVASQNHQTKHNGPTHTPETQKTTEQKRNAILASVGRRTPNQAGQAGIHHTGSSKRAPGKAAEDRSGESSMGRGGGQMQLQWFPEGVQDLPKENTSVQEHQAPEQHPQHGGEGEPHTGPKPLLPQDEVQRGSKAHRHTRPQGMATGPPGDVRGCDSRW